MMNIEMKWLICARCEHRWVPRKPEVRVCPRCHSPYWDKRRAALVEPTPAVSQSPGGIETLLRKMVRKIVKVADPEKVVLFGSHATGHARPGSDVDLLVITRRGESRRQMAVDLYRALRGAGVGKDIVVVRPEEFEKYRDVLGTILYPAAHEGRVLYDRAA